MDLFGNKLDPFGGNLLLNIASTTWSIQGIGGGQPERK